MCWNNQAATAALPGAIQNPKPRAAGSEGICEGAKKLPASRAEGPQQLLLARRDKLWLGGAGKALLSSSFSPRRSQLSTPGVAFFFFGGGGGRERLDLWVQLQETMTLEEPFLVSKSSTAGGSVFYADEAGP